MTKKPERTCPVCGSASHIPHRSYNSYCWEHIDGENQCIAITRKGWRCKNPVMPNKYYCETHLKKYPKKSVTRVQERGGEVKLPGGRGPGYVYIVNLSRGLYKIGRSNDVDRRLNALRASNPWCEMHEATVVFNSARVEKKLHTLFEDKNEGREVYRLAPDDLKVAAEIMEEHKYKSENREGRWLNARPGQRGGDTFG